MVELTDKIKVTISLRKNIWEQYQQYCKDNDLIPSYEFQKFIRGQLNENKKRTDAET